MLGVLHQKHNIELAFVNSPHIVANTPPTGDNIQDGIGRDDERVWYHGEKKLGLDATILHLRQIWSQSLYSNPFSGILGIGQGAAVAALLPFLRFDVPLPMHHDDINDKDEDGNDNDGYSDTDCTLMFEGLQFCTFVNGWDLLQVN